MPERASLLQEGTEDPQRLMREHFSSYREAQAPIKRERARNEALDIVFGMPPDELKAKLTPRFEKDPGVMDPVMDAVIEASASRAGSLTIAGGPGKLQEEQVAEEVKHVNAMTPETLADLFRRNPELLTSIEAAQEVLRRTESPYEELGRSVTAAENAGAIEVKAVREEVKEVMEKPKEELI